MATTQPLRTVVWATGTIGRHAIAGVDAHPDLDLVGVWVSTPEKAGRDAGDLAELGRDLGVAATAERADIVALAPDIVVHTAMTDDRVIEALDDLAYLLSNGINVVSSGPVLLQYPYGVLWADGLKKIEQACIDGGTSLYVNGIDPGFANDVLPLVLSSLSQRIDLVRVSEIADYSTYLQPVVMRDLFGFGAAMDDTSAMLWQPGVLSMAWGSVVRQIAAGLGVELDEPLVEVVERRASESAVQTVSLPIAAGTMAAVRFQVIGRVNGVDKIVLEHVTRTHVDQAPDWPQPLNGGGCYRVEIQGEPMMQLDLTHHGENGDHNVSGMITTAQRLVNAAPHVVSASPGIATALDLMHVTGKGLVS